MFLVCITSALGFLGLWTNNSILLVTAPVMGGSLNRFFSFQVLIDERALIFLCVLLLIVRVIVLFENEYMKGELYRFRFSVILYSFVGRMVFLILSSKLLLALVGWDGLGITRFLLICFYKTRVRWSSSLKTFLINRLGDGFLLLVVCYLFLNGDRRFGSFSSPLSSFIRVVLVLALITKRAKYPFSSWLPAAMAAPTPVSALVHSSTLVTAGVYLLIRLNPLFRESSLELVSLIGLWTIFIARFSACLEEDLKKVIAFSTLSQLGLMVYSVGIGVLNLTLFHLLTHALFKAKMFICAGYILMATNHNQDLRCVYSPPVSWVTLVSLWLSVFNLKGGLYLSGFMSKDSILDTGFNFFNVVLGIVFSVSLCLTALYSLRMLLSFRGRIYRRQVGLNIGSRLVPIYLSFLSLVFGWWMVNSTFSFHSPTGLFKNFILGQFALSIVMVVFLPYVGAGQWAHNIGGINFFNADAWLDRWSSRGRFRYDVMEKGLLRGLSLRVTRLIGRFNYIFWGVSRTLIVMGLGLLFRLLL